MIPNELKIVRADWEQGLTPLSVIDQIDCHGNVLVVLEDGRNRYHCHRYFQLGDTWTCSADGQAVPLEAVFSWLNNPCAMTTRPHEYVYPQSVTA
jgi:hypothetical protein